MFLQACSKTDLISCNSEVKGGWRRMGRGESLYGSGCEVGVLHGVETVDGVSHSPRQ